MYTAKRIVPILLLGLVALLVTDCKKTQTEAEFVNEKILTTGMNTRVNGLQDLLHFAALQKLKDCQQDCQQLEEAAQAAEKEVIVLEDQLAAFTGGIKPPPPCPCDTGNCLWERLAVFSYFVDVEKFNLPEVMIQTVNGETISSSADATVAYSPDGGQYALVNLPQKDFEDKAVKMVINGPDGTSEVLVNVK